MPDEKKTKRNKTKQETKREERERERMFDKMQIQQLRTFDISVRLMFTIFGECNGARSQRRQTCLNNGTKLMRIDANFLALKSFLIDEKRGKKIQIYVRVRTRAV